MAWLRVSLGVFLVFGSLTKGFYNRWLGKKQIIGQINERRVEEMSKDEDVDAQLITPVDAYEWLRERSRTK